MEMQNLKFQNESEALMKCPRCDSLDTKFCYYNNYNYSQPRHFCKSCRRYWTIGGLLRNVPVGGGTRKSKSSKSAIKSPSIGNSNSKSIPICDDPQFMNSSTPVNNAAASAAAYAVPSSSVIYHHDDLKMKGNEFGMSSEMGGFTAPVRMNEGEMEELMKIYGSNNNNNNGGGGGGVDEAANFWFKFCGLTNTPFNN